MFGTANIPEGFTQTNSFLRDLGHSLESWETKFGKLLGYLEENVDLEHDKIMVNHFQFAKNRDIDQNLGTQGSTDLVGPNFKRSWTLIPSGSRSKRSVDSC